MPLTGYTTAGAVADCDVIDPTWGNQVVTNQATFAGNFTAEYVVQFNTTQVSITGTSNATTILEYTVPAGQLGTGNILEFDVWGKAENLNASDAVSGFVTMLYGATTVATQTVSGIAGASSDNGIHIFGIFGATGASTSQWGMFDVTNAINIVGDNGAANENSATELDFVLSFAWEGASTDYTFTKYASKVKLSEV